TEPMPWENGVEYAGIIALTAKLIRLRRNVDGLTKGLTGQHVDVFHLNNKDKIVAFRRSFASGPTDDVIVIANFANQRLENYQIGLPAGGHWKRRFSSDRKQYSEDFGDNASGDIQAEHRTYDGQSHCGRIQLPPYTVLIYSQDA
ncbi:MAG: alpha amylase C-terminal domain-containing protein, partial [Aureliella sp.]